MGNMHAEVCIYHDGRLIERTLIPEWVAHRQDWGWDRVATDHEFIHGWKFEFCKRPKETVAR